MYRSELTYEPKSQHGEGVPVADPLDYDGRATG